MSGISRPLSVLTAGALALTGALVALEPAAAAVGTTFYVDASGDDTTGDGSLGNPYLTIQKAVDEADDGDSVVVGEGTFAGFSTDLALTFEGHNAGVGGEDWAGSIHSTVITSDVEIEGESTLDGFEFGDTVTLAHGAEGASVVDNVFQTGATQLGIDGLDGTEETVVEFNTFLQLETTGAPEAILITDSAYITINQNAFYGDPVFTGSAAVRLDGGAIGQIFVTVNTANYIAGLLVADAPGSPLVGIIGVEVSDNLVLDSPGRPVVIGDNVDVVSIGDNVFRNGDSSAVAIDGDSGPQLAINGNEFTRNAFGIDVAASSISVPLDATENRFWGNAAAIRNASTVTVDASLGSWSIPTGPFTTGRDAIVGAGPVTTSPVAVAPAAFVGGTSDTAGLTTTVHFGLAWANTTFTLGASGYPDTFSTTVTDSSGDASVTWPAGTPVGAQKVIVDSGIVTYIPVTIPSPSALTSSPVPGISGHLVVGRTLTAITRTWPVGVTLAYQWYATSVPIDGATSSTFVLTPAQVGKKITLRVAGYRTGEASFARTSPASVAVAPGTLIPAIPVVSGSRTVGATLTATPGTWGPVATTLSYRWLRDGVTITGATSATYQQVAADLNHRIQAKVIGSAAGYTTVFAVSVKNPTKTAPRLVGTPSAISVVGTPAVGTKLTVSTTGSWSSGAKLTYAWRLDGILVKGATKSSYTPVAADIGKKVSVTITGTKSRYTTAKITSPQTVAVVAGTFTSHPDPVVTAAKVGYPAAVILGSWAAAPTSYRYQWYLDGVLVVGATGATFTPPGTSLGQDLSVEVTGVRSGFTSVTEGSASKTIASGVFSETVKPVVTGSAKVGRVLTAKVTGWKPAAQYAYQWKLDGVPIAGAIDDVYTVSTEDLGGRLTVSVTGARLGFTSVTETSNPTAVVIP